MKILFLITEAPPVKSGFSTMAEKLARGMKKRGHQVTTFTLADTKYASIYAFRPNLAFLHRLNPSKYDIIHINGHSPLFSELMLLKYLPYRKKMVYTYHCDANSKYSLINKLYNGLHYQLLKIPRKIVCTTPDYAKYVNMPDKTTVIPFGVDVPKKAPRKSEKEFNVLFVGQMRLYKGVDVLLRAWKEIPDIGHLHLVGDGIDRELWVKLAKDLELKNLTWHGRLPRDKLNKLYDKSHMVVLPSVNTCEAFGIVLLEGMARGCFPVSSDLRGVRYLTKWLGASFPVGDHEKLARLIKKVKDEKLWKKKEKDIKKFLGDHTWKKFVDRYEKVYESITS